MDEAAHLLQLFFLDEVERIEILHFCGDLAGEISGIEVADAGYAALAREQVLPDFFGGVGHRADQPQAGDNYPTWHVPRPLSGRLMELWAAVGITYRPWSFSRCTRQRPLP